jgi:hypothetical protein
MSAKLICRRWLYRLVEIVLPDGRHVVEYNGKGIGYEQVMVDFRVIRAPSWYWFVPRFDFEVGGLPARLEVRVWPWLLLRSFVLRVGDEIVYAEGTLEVDVRRAAEPRDWRDLA